MFTDTSQFLVPHLIFYMITIYCVKISILYFVRRLAGPMCTRAMSWTIKSFFIFHTSYVLACLFTVIFQCNPVIAAFDLATRFHPDTKCRNLVTFYWITSAIHACADIASLALPMAMVLRMRMSWEKKLAVCFMFGLGGLACVCSIIRMIYIDRWYKSSEISCKFNAGGWLARRLTPPP